MAVYQEMRDGYIAALQKECETMVDNLNRLSDPPFSLTEGTTGLLLAPKIESDIWDKHDDGNQGWNDEDHPYDIAMESLIHSLVSYNQRGQEDWDKWLEFLLYHLPGDVQKIREVTEHSLVRNPQQCYHVLVDFFRNLNDRLIQYGKYPENEMIAGEIEFRVQAIIEYWEDWAFSGDYAKIEEKVEKEMEKLRNAEPDFLTYRKYMHKKFQDTCDGRFKHYPNPDPNASDEVETFSDEDNNERHNGNDDTDTSDSVDNASDEYSPLYGGNYIISDDGIYAGSNGNIYSGRNGSNGGSDEELAADKESNRSSKYSGQDRELGSKNEDSGNGDQNGQSPADNNSEDDGEDDDTVRDRWHNTICDAIDDIDTNLSRTGRFPFYVVEDSSHHTDVLQSRFPLIKYRAQYEAAGEAFVKTFQDIKEKSQSDDFLAWRHFLHVKFPTTYPKPKPSLKQRRDKAYTLILNEYKWFDKVIKTNGHYPQYVIGAEATLEDLARRHETKIYNDWHNACPESEDEYSGLVEVDIAELLAKRGRHTPALQFKNWRMFLTDMFPGVQLQSEVSHPSMAQPLAHMATAGASSTAQTNDEDTEMIGYIETPSEELSSARSPPPNAHHLSKQVIEGIFKGGITKPCYDPSSPDKDDSDCNDNDSNKAVIDILATLTAAFNNSLQYEHAGRHLQYIVPDERKFAEALRKKIHSITTDIQPYEAVAKSCYESLNHTYQHRATDDFLAWRSFLHDSFPGQYPAPLLVTDFGTDFSVTRTAAVSNLSSDRVRPEDQDQDKSNFQTTRVRIRSTLRGTIETINNKIELDGRFPEYIIRGQQKLVELAEFLENEAFLRSGNNDDYEIQVDACYENLQLIEFHCESDGFFDWKMFLFRNFPAEKLPMPQRIIAAPVGIPSNPSQLLPIQDEVKSNVHGNESEDQSPPISKQTCPEPAIQSMHMKSDEVHSMDIDSPDNDRTAIVHSEAAQLGVNGVGLELISGIQAALPASGPSAPPTVSPLEGSLPAQKIEHPRDLDNIFGPDASQDRTTLFTSKSLGNPASVKITRKMATPRGKLVKKSAPPPRMTSENNLSMLFNQLAAQAAPQPVPTFLSSAPYAKLSSDIVGQGPADSTSNDNLTGFRLKPESTRFLSSLPLSSPAQVEDPIELSPGATKQSDRAPITQNAAVLAPGLSELFARPATAKMTGFIESTPYEKIDAVPEKVGSKASPQTPAPKPALNNPSLGGAFIPFKVDQGFNSFNIGTPTAPVELEEEDKGIIRREKIRETVKKYGSPLRPRSRASNTVLTTVTSQPPVDPLAPAGSVMNPFDPVLFKSFPKPIVPTGSVFGKALHTPTRAPFKIVTDFNGGSFGAFNMPTSPSMKEDVPVKTENTSTIVCRPASIRKPEVKNIAAIPLSIDGLHTQSLHPADGKSPLIVEKPVSVPEPEVQTAPSVPVSTFQPEPPLSPIEQPPKLDSKSDIELSPVSSDLSNRSIWEDVQLAPTDHASFVHIDSESDLSPVPSDLSDRSVPEDVQTASVIQSPIVPPESPESPKTAPIIDQAKDSIQQSAEVILESNTKETVTDAMTTTAIAPLQSDAILNAVCALHRDVTSNTAGFKTEVIDLKDKLSILQADFDAFKAKQYEDRLARVESGIASIKEQVALNEEHNAKRHEESTTIQMATNDTVNQIFAFLKANETEKKVVQKSRPVDAPSPMDSEPSKKTEQQETLVESSKQVKTGVQGPSKIEEEKAVVKIEIADSRLDELKSKVGEEVGVKPVQEAAPTETVATAEVDIMSTSSLQKTGLHPTLISEAFQAPQAPVKKLSFSSVITVYVAEPTNSARNGTSAPGESRAIKDLDVPLNQPAKIVLTKQTPVETSLVKKIDKASQILFVELPQQRAVTSSAAGPATNSSKYKLPTPTTIEATPAALGLLRSAGAYTAYSDTSKSSQKAVEATVTNVVLFNPDGSLNETIPHDKLLLALSRHECDLGPKERHIVVECARGCLSFKEFWARVEDEGFGDLHELGYDLLEAVKTYLRNILDIRTLAQHANLTDRIQTFRSAYSAGEAFRQCSKSGLQSIYEIHTTIKDNLHIAKLEGRDLDKCETHKRALSSFHWNIDHTIKKYWIAHKKYVDALDKLQRFENDIELARHIDHEHHTSQAYFEDQLKKLGIDPANPHMY